MKAENFPEIPLLPHHAPAFPHGISGAYFGVICHDKKSHRQTHTCNDAGDDEAEEPHNGENPHQQQRNDGLDESVSGAETIEQHFNLRMTLGSRNAEKIDVLPDGQGAHDNDAHKDGAGDALENCHENDDGNGVEPRTLKRAVTMAIEVGVEGHEQTGIQGLLCGVLVSENDSPFPPKIQKFKQHPTRTR